MAERSKNSPSSSKRKETPKFAPKPRVKKSAKQASSKIIFQEENQETKPVVIDKDIMRRINTRQAVRKIAITRDVSNSDNTDQKPQSSIQAHVYSKKKKHEVEPYIILPLRPDNTNLELLNKKEFGDAEPNSIQIESSINPAKDLDLEKESENERMLLFKLPKSLPLERQESDKKGKKQVKKQCCNLQELPSNSGLVGKMLVYKSGKVKMKLGDVIFDVDPGTKCLFSQQVVAVNTKKKSFCEIGKLDEQHVIVTPDIDALLDDNKV